MTTTDLPIVVDVDDVLHLVYGGRSIARVTDRDAVEQMIDDLSNGRARPGRPATARSLPKPGTLSRGLLDHLRYAGPTARPDEFDSSVVTGLQRSGLVCTVAKRHGDIPALYDLTPLARDLYRQHDDIHPAATES